MNYAENWIAQQTAEGKSPLAFLQNIPGMAGMPDLAAMMAGMPPGRGHAPRSPAGELRRAPAPDDARPLTARPSFSPLNGGSSR